MIFVAILFISGLRKTIKKCVICLYTDEQYTANDSNSSKVHHREGYLTTAQIKPVKFTLLHWASSVLFFSC